MNVDNYPPPLPKKKGGTISTNADQEFLKVVREGHKNSSQHAEQHPHRDRNPRRSSRCIAKGQIGGVKQGEPVEARRTPHGSYMVDEDEATNFLIEENLRRQKRYFGASLQHPGAKMEPMFYNDVNPSAIPAAIAAQRNPTLGEIIRGEAKNASKRSLQGFQNRQRSTGNYSSDRQILPPPSTFSDVPVKDIREALAGTRSNMPFSQKSTVELPQMVSNENVFRPSENAGKPKVCSQGYSEGNWIETLSQENIPKSVQEVIRSIENENKNKCKKHNKPAKKQNEELPHKDKFSSHEQITLENGLLKRFFFKKGIADHSERDSLDGNLPGSSHGTSTGNPPPAPSPPENSNNDNSNINNSSTTNNNNSHNSVNNNTEGVSPSTSAFSKGPNAKSKKHKRLKNDSGTLDFPSKDKENVKKRPSYEDMKTRDLETGGYRSKTEPYTYLWVVLSRMYGKLVVLLMLAFCLTEVLDNKIAPLMFQEVFLLYLYVGSIIAIMCIYVTVIIDNCPSITASKENLTKPGDPESGSITSFGTLKRAHISRAKTSRTSFYLRVGALVFGLGTLIYNGLEIAMHSSIPEGCVSDTILAHPIMQALFTFLQMHFLFVNSEVIVEKFGQVARFGFMHLVATNLALWVRMVVWESANDSMDIIEERGVYETAFGPTALGFHTLELQRLTKCYQNNTLGELWGNSQQYLFPFMVQYSLIAASVTYIMWCNVGKERLSKLCGYGKSYSELAANSDKRNKGQWRVDCRSASKGLFAGLLVLVGGIVILIIFFVMKDQEEFKNKLFWMSTGTMMIILSLSIMATIFGFIQIPKLSISTTQPMDLDRLLLSSTVIGVYIFAIFSMIVGGIDYNNSEKLAAFSSSMLLLIQASLQGMLVAEASRRKCTNRFQMLTKPGRQVITFLLFSNVTLWILDTFMTHNSVTHVFQIEFYGKVVWGVISRISLPLMILFRFHSAVILVEIWKNTYRTKAD